MADETALIQFHLGPVQPFVEAARTVRDLWTGSYLLSWLTVAAIRPVLERGDAELISPAVGGNSLVAAYLSARGYAAHPRHRVTAADGDPLVPSLPNRFYARISGVPADDLREIVDSIERACRDEWRRIAGAVRDELDRLLGPITPRLVTAMGRSGGRVLRGPRRGPPDHGHG